LGSGTAFVAANNESRRQPEKFLRFTTSTCYEHPHRQIAIGNYAGLLEDLGQSPEQIRERLDEIVRPFGITSWD
jgi:hypothetical protein